MLYAEGASYPKMLSIGLHTKRSGKPGHVAAMAEFLRYASRHPRVWFAGRDEIAPWWWEHYPPPTSGNSCSICTGVRLPQWARLKGISAS